MNAVLVCVRVSWLADHVTSWQLKPTVDPRYSNFEILVLSECNTAH